jgi:hypothetical protein
MGFSNIFGGPRYNARNLSNLQTSIEALVKQIRKMRTIIGDKFDMTPTSNLIQNRNLAAAKNKMSGSIIGFIRKYNKSIDQTIRAVNAFQKGSPTAPQALQVATQTLNEAAQQLASPPPLPPRPAQQLASPPPLPPRPQQVARPPPVPLLAPPPGNINMFIKNFGSTNTRKRNFARNKLKSYLNNPALNKNTKNKIRGILGFETLPSILPQNSFTFKPPPPTALPMPTFGRTQPVWAPAPAPQFSLAGRTPAPSQNNMRNYVKVMEALRVSNQISKLTNQEIQSKRLNKIITTRNGLAKSLLKLGNKFNRQQANNLQKTINRLTKAINSRGVV